MMGLNGILFLCSSPIKIHIIYNTREIKKRNNNNVCEYGTVDARCLAQTQFYVDDVGMSIECTLSCTHVKEEWR